MVPSGDNEENFDYALSKETCAVRQVQAAKPSDVGTNVSCTAVSRLSRPVCVVNSNAIAVSQNPSKYITKVTQVT